MYTFFIISINTLITDISILAAAAGCVASAFHRLLGVSVHSQTPSFLHQERVHQSLLLLSHILSLHLYVVFVCNNTWLNDIYIPNVKKWQFAYIYIYVYITHGFLCGVDFCFEDQYFFKLLLFPLAHTYVPGPCAAAALAAAATAAALAMACCCCCLRSVPYCPINEPSSSKRH